MKNIIAEEKAKAGILIVLVILIVLILAFSAYLFTSNKTSMKKLFAKVEDTEGVLTEYIVYGNHLNIKGEIEDKFETIKSVNLVLDNLSGEEKKIKLKYEIDGDTLKFYTSDLINTGIDLESISTSKYYALLEVEFLKDSKYYSIQNQTNYDEVVYYTITRNNSNNKIDIAFNTYKTEERNINYMFMDVKSAKLPKDVYDVVIDPGHGGSDNGAEYGGYSESDLTLKYANKVKSELENLGLKVKITRDGTENPDAFGVYNVYDEDGRVNIVGKSKAKYVFSIHLNSIDVPNSQSGVEIYAPTRMDLSLAKAFAGNIVKYGNTSYSDLEATYRVYDGVYVRTFKEWEVEDSEEAARKAGYEPYIINANTPYLYMLRETGGIATFAYVDGRNKSYGKNLYYDSNVGVEAYLLELGYMNNTENLKNLLNNQDGYVNGIVETVKEKIMK